MKSMALLALVGSALLTATAQAGAVKTPSTAVAGDLLLGVRATGGTGTSLDVIVDLGAASGFTSTQTVTTGTLNSALTSAFGSDWATRTDVQVGVIGTTGPVGADAKTLFASNARSSASNPSTPWTTASSTLQGGASSQILAALGAFKASASATAVTQNTSDANSWASFQAVDSSFGFFSPTIEGAPSQTLDLFKLTPNAAGVPATRLGTLKLNADATVSFTAQADVDSAVAASSIDFTAPVVKAVRGATSVTINLVRSGGSVPVTATLTTSNGTATAPTVSAAAGAISFDANVNMASITIPVTPNTGLTGKQFNVALADILGTNASLGSTNPTAVVILPGIETGTPFLNVTAPLATASIIGQTAAGNLTVSGQADDNIGITAVMVKVNSSAFKKLTLTPPATAPGNKQNFSQALTGVLDIINGLNTVTVRAVDTSGNTTDIVRYVRYTAKGNLTFVYTGTSVTSGLVTPTLAPSVAGAYQVGNLYTVTAKQFDSGTAAPTASSFVFSGWLVGSNPTLVPGLSLTFTMSTDLLTSPTITAVYVASPFTSAVTSGIYAGLITNDAGYASTNATNGYISVAVTTSGALTGSMKLNGALLTFTSGKLANDGTVLFGATPAAQVPYARFTTSPVTATLKFNFATKVLTGVVYDSTNLSTFTAPLQTATPVTAASYTFRLPTAAVLTGGLTTDTFPQGDTVGTATISSAGVVNGSIVVSDTKTATFSTVVSGNGTFPLFASPYGATAATAGSISGLVTITGGSLSASSVKWFRPANVFTASGSYAAGWPTGQTVTLEGGVYSSAASPLYTGAAAGNHATFFGFGTSLGATNLSNAVDVGATSFVLHPTAVGTSTPTATLTFTIANGIVGGTRAGTPAYPFKGVILQGAATPGVYGWFSTGTTTAAGKQGRFQFVP